MTDIPELEIDTTCNITLEPAAPMPVILLPSGALYEFSAIKMWINSLSAGNFRQLKCPKTNLPITEIKNAEEVRPLPKFASHNCRGN